MTHARTRTSDSAHAHSPSVLYHTVRPSNTQCAAAPPAAPLPARSSAMAHARPAGRPCEQQRVTAPQLCVGTHARAGSRPTPFHAVIRKGGIKSRTFAWGRTQASWPPGHVPGAAGGAQSARGAERGGKAGAPVQCGPFWAGAAGRARGRGAGAGQAQQRSLLACRQAGTASHQWWRPRRQQHTGGRQVTDGLAAARAWSQGRAARERGARLACQLGSVRSPGQARSSGVPRTWAGGSRGSTRAGAGAGAEGGGGGGRGALLVPHAMGRQPLEDSKHPFATLGHAAAAAAASAGGWGAGRPLLGQGQVAGHEGRVATRGSGVGEQLAGMHCTCGAPPPFTGAVRITDARER